jgi:DHA3 family tetracycline resistance protein-like MFS transporter
MKRPSPYRFYLAAEAALAVPSFIVIAIYFVQRVHLSPLQLVLVGTVMEAAVFVFQVPTGIVADLYGRKLSVVIACAIMGPGTILVGAVPQFWAALVGWTLWGFGVTFIDGAWEAWITDEVGSENVGPVFVRGMQIGSVGALVGLPLWIGLATVSLQGTVIADGAVTLAFGLLAIPLMPERAFRPQERGRGAGLRTARKSASLIRGRPLVLLLVAAAFFAGAYSEGLDRLWEAHFLRDIGLPGFLGLSHLWWFAVLGGGALLLGLLVSNVLVKRVSADTSDRSMARLLLVLAALQIASAAAFGLATSFVLALLAFWAARVTRRLSNPVYMTWLNQSIGDSSVRATVISMSGQSDAVGQVALGPAVGAIGSWLGIRAALVTAGLLLSPAAALYARALRHGGREPELEQLPVPAEI